MDLEFCFRQSHVSLEQALQETLQLSRSQIKKSTLSSKQLKSQVMAQKPYALPLDLLNHGRIHPEYQGPDIEVLFEDNNFLVLNKPPNIHCHPLKYSDQKTVLNFLLQQKRYLELVVNQEAYDRGLLYRLDYGTSGVLIYVKQEKLWQDLRQNFATAAKEKKYVALVTGYFDQEGKWTHYLQVSGQKGQKVIATETGFKAMLKVKRTHYHSKKNLSLLEIELITGHRHQIRAQLKALGFPILGDELYGGQRAERLFLHALSYQLQFKELLCLKTEAPLAKEFLTLFPI